MNNQPALAVPETVQPCRPTKPWFIYFIECRDGSIYTGTTTNVQQRFQKHVTGKGARYTRMNPPVRLLGFVALDSRGAALSAESRFKRLPASVKRKWIADLRRAEGWLVQACTDVVLNKFVTLKIQTDQTTPIRSDCRSRKQSQ